MKTRERILATSLALFNEQGEPNVTTVDIAHEMDISPGNLYYHYHHKSEIIHALLDQFEHTLLDTMEAAATGMLGLADHTLLLQLVFDVIWEYRFFYRDLNNFFSNDVLIKKKFLRLMEKQKKAAFQVLKSYVNHGAMQANTSRLYSLVDHILLILNFWINDQQLHGRTQKETVITSGIEQINQLLIPYMMN